MKNQKVWGETRLVFKNDNFEVHRILAKKGGFCSTHSHVHKHNIFYVESGCIKIIVKKNDYDLTDITELHSLEMTDVAPGEVHSFEAVEDTIAYEIYYSEPISGDIIRESVGGMK